MQKMRKLTSSLPTAFTDSNTEDCLVHFSSPAHGLPGQILRQPAMPFQISLHVGILLSRHSSAWAAFLDLETGSRARLASPPPMP